MRRNTRKNWDKRRSRGRRGPEKPAGKRDHEANERATRIVSPSRETKRLLEGIGTPRPAPFKPDPFQLEALAALEKCLDLREERMIWTKDEPRFANISNEPAFKVILKKMRLE